MNMKLEIQVEEIRKRGRILLMEDVPADRGKKILETVQRDVDAMYKFAEMSQDELKENIKDTPNNIRYCIDPSEDLQLVCVEANKYSIQYIKESTRDVQIEAVTDRPDVIGYIEQQHPDAIRLVLKTNGFFIQNIHTQTQEYADIAFACVGACANKIEARFRTHEMRTDMFANE